MKLSDVKNTAFILILVTIIIACFSLGIWQLDRYSQKQQHDTPSAEVDVHVEIAELTHAKNNEALLDKTVNISGSFINNIIIKLDNKMFNSVYGVDLFSMFREETSGKVYLVNMGWFEVGNKREKLQQNFDFSGIHSLHTKIAKLPSKPPFISEENFRDDVQQDLWLFFNKEYLTEHYASQIEEPILINLEPTDQLKYRTIVREDNSFMHIMYAIQWFLFALFALFGLTKIYK